MKEYYVPYTLIPQYDREYTELYNFSWRRISKIIIFQIKEHQPTIMNQYNL